MKIQKEFTIQNPLVPILIYLGTKFYRCKYRKLIGINIELYNRIYTVRDVWYHYYYSGILEVCVYLEDGKYSDTLRLNVFLNKVKA